MAYSKPETRRSQSIVADVLQCVNHAATAATGFYLGVKAGR